MPYPYDEETLRQGRVYAETPNPLRRRPNLPSAVTGGAYTAPAEFRAGEIGSMFEAPKPLGPSTAAPQLRSVDNSIMTPRLQRQGLDAARTEVAPGVTREGVLAGTPGLPGTGVHAPMNTAMGVRDGVPVKYTVGGAGGYTDSSGNPVKTYEQSAQYAQGVALANRERAQLAALAQSYARAGNRNKAFELAGSDGEINALAQDALDEGDLMQRTQKGGRRGAIAASLLNQRSQDRTAAARLSAENNRFLIEQLGKGEDRGIKREEVGLQRDKYAIDRQQLQRSLASDALNEDMKRNEEMEKQFSVYTTADGKPDATKNQALRSMVFSTANDMGKPFAKMTAEEKARAIEVAKLRMDTRDDLNLRNVDRQMFNARDRMDAAPVPQGGPRKSTIRDVLGGSLEAGEWARMKMPWNDNLVVPFKNERGQEMLLADDRYRKIMGARGVADLRNRKLLKDY